MASVPKAIDYDVWNSVISSASYAFIGACRSLSTQLTNDNRDRASALPAVEADFAGFFADLFRGNQGVRVQDAQRLSDALSDIVMGVEQAQEAAQAEQARIERAREWKREHDEWESDRWYYLQGVYDFFYSEPKIDTADLTRGEPPQIRFRASVTAGNRDMPGIGSKVGEATVSSARPQELDTYTSFSNGLCDALEGVISKLSEAYDAFEASWVFKDGARAVVGMSEFIAACRVFNTANRDENAWLAAISHAFKLAGSASEVVSLSDQALLYSLSQAGVSVEGRQRLQIPEVRLAGMNASTGYADDPVNTVTGNFIEPEEDLRLVGSGSALYFSRMYNSFTAVQQISEADEPRVGVCGIGWESVIDQRLSFADELVSWVREDGRHVQFMVPNGQWDGNVALKAERDVFWLQKVVSFTYFKETEFFADFFNAGDADFVIADNDGNCWIFNQVGNWVGSWCGPGSGVRVHRCEETGLVEALEHENGARLSFVYAGNKLTRVNGSNGSYVQFEYLEDQLVSVRTLEGARRYAHNTAGLIREVISAAGVRECVNTYDETGRVLSQVSAHGRESRYVYLPGNVTVVSDIDGGRSNTWIADVYGRTVGIIDSDGQRVSRSFDSNNNLLSVTDRAGKQTFNFFNERGKIVRTVLPTRGEIRYEWDEYDRLLASYSNDGPGVRYIYEPLSFLRNPVEVHDALGGVTTLKWDGAKLLELRDPVGVTLRFGYDTRGNLTSIENASGNKVSYTRDNAGRVISTTTPMGSTFRLTYDELGRVDQLEDPAGATWKYAYDDAGRPLSVTDPYGNVSSVSYDASGQVYAHVDELGNATTFSYDDLGNLSGMRLPDESMWWFSHDALSRLKEIADPSGAVWRYGFDVNGVLNQFSDPTGLTTVVAEDTIGRKIKANINGKSFSEVEFDAYGKIIKTVSADNVSTRVSYDAAGNVIELIDANGGITRFERDIAGRIVSQIDATGVVTSYTYDSCGRVETCRRNGRGVETYYYNADSKVSRVVKPGGEEATFDYDECGRLVAGYIPGQGRFERSYDLCGRLIYSKDLINGIRQFKYNEAGQLVKAINGVGGVTSYAYDKLGQIIRITAPDGSIATREYDAVGNLIAVTDWFGNKTVASYDEAHRVVSQTGPDGISLSYSYDANGELEAITADGKILSRFERKQAERVLRLSDYTNPHNPQPITHILEWDSLGRLRYQESATTRGKQRQEWKYDKAGRRKTFISDGLETVFQYDENGLLTSLKHPLLGGVEFCYDEAGRLTQTVKDGSVSSWSYHNGFVQTASNVIASAEIERDVWGRVTKLTRNGETVTYAYDDANQLVESYDGRLSIRWEYDNLGQVTRKTGWENTDLVWELEFTYNGPGQVKQTQIYVNSPNGMSLYATSVFSYDKAGNRRSETTTSYHEDGSQTSVTIEYQWDVRGYLRSIERFSAEQRESLSVQVDALGRLIHVGNQELTWDTNSVLPQLLDSGVETESKWVHVEGNSNPFNRWLKIDLLDPYANSGAAVTVGGLQWLGERVYDPTTQSFLSTDPWPYPDTGSMWESNTYSYAANNPLTLVDPNGLKPITDLQVIETYNTNRVQATLPGVGKFLDDYGAYIGSGVMIGLGIAAMATGVGGPIGAAMISGALISGGITMGTSEFTDGKIDWNGFWRDSFIGAGLGFVGGSASVGFKSLLYSKSASAQNAVTRYAMNTKVKEAGVGLWSWIKGETKLVNAVLHGVNEGDDLRHLTILDDIFTPFVGDIAEANVGYGIDVFQGERELSAKGVVLANSSSLFDTIIGGPVRGLRGSALNPLELTTDATRGQRIKRFMVDFGVDTYLGGCVDALQVVIERRAFGEEAANDLALDAMGDISQNFGDNLHNAVPELDRNMWIPEVKRFFKRE